MEKEVIVIGAGLSGSEAAYQLAKNGIKVKMRQGKICMRIVLWEYIVY